VLDIKQFNSSQNPPGPSAFINTVLLTVVKPIPKKAVVAIEEISFLMFIVAPFWLFRSCYVFVHLRRFLFLFSSHFIQAKSYIPLK